MDAYGCIQALLAPADRYAHNLICAEPEVYTDDRFAMHIPHCYTSSHNP